MEFDCDKCIHRSNAEKFMYCKECSTCTNGEVEDTDNHFTPKDFTQDSCIMYLQANGWLVKHDREITLGERNKLVDEIRKEVVELATKKQIYLNDIYEITKKYKTDLS